MNEWISMDGWMDGWMDGVWTGNFHDIIQVGNWFFKN
jgi:hypothetical protein